MTESESRNQLPYAKGRGSQSRPDNRFSKIHVEPDWEHLEHDAEARLQLQNIKTNYYVDHSKTLINTIDSPDIGFRFSMNVYRGCSHGCSYCYARPTHEYLDLNAGLDFETKIFVKQNAPQLLRDRLAADDWKPETIMMSGVTDCYQPAEKHFELTRRCLEVLLEARQPVAIITKNSLICRDLDLLQEMAAQQLVSVAISLTSLDQSLIKQLEPRTSSPAARLRAIEKLTTSQIPVHVMMAPIIPGLTDSEIPALLKAAAEAGAKSSGFVMLRLPLTVKPVFLEWLERTHPSHAERILSCIRAVRAGELSSAEFGKRMTGTGALAEQVKQTFRLFARKYQIDSKPAPLDSSRFRPPVPSSGQLRLFD